MSTQAPEAFKPNSPTIGAKPPPVVPTPKPTPAAPTSSAALKLPIDKIDASPTQPRKRFPSEEDLRTLGESIVAHGLLQPVLVRPHPTKKDRFELVFGECRWRASKLVGLKEIDARCRELTDLEVLEIQIIENNKRADVHPLEEAEAYEQLRAKHGYDVDKIAEKINKSRSHVYQRIKLMALSAEARDAVLADKIPTSCGLYVARIPSKAHQAEAIKAIANGQYGEGPMSAREAQDYVTRKYMLKMVDAPFDLKDEKLVPAAGACATCPKRTKNAKDLFPDIKTDMCTDPDCFQAKHEAHWAQLAETAKKEGRPVLKTRVAPAGWDYGSSEYISLDAKSQNDPKNRTYRELLKGAKVQIALAKGTTGEIVEAVKREDAAAFMATKFNFAKKREERRKNDDQHEAVFDLERKTRERAIAEAVKVVERRQPKAGFFRAVVHALEWSNPELLSEALTRRGLGEDVREALESVKDEAMLRGIIAEVVCGEPSHVEENGRTELFAAYGIEEKSFAKAAKAELAKEAAAEKEKEKKK